MQRIRHRIAARGQRIGSIRVDRGSEPDPVRRPVIGASSRPEPGGV